MEFVSLPEPVAFERVVARVRESLASYAPPDFAHVPDPDAAIFLCAIDHRTGWPPPSPRVAVTVRSRAAP